MRRTIQPHVCCRQERIAHCTTYICDNSAFRTVELPFRARRTKNSQTTPDQSCTSNQYTETLIASKQMLYIVLHKTAKHIIYTEKQHSMLLTAALRSLLHQLKLTSYLCTAEHISCKTIHTQLAGHNNSECSQDSELHQSLAIAVV